MATVQVPLQPDSYSQVAALFQFPLGVLGATRMGVVSIRQLRDNRRYAVLVIAVLAMLLPGTDPITLVLSMIPLLLLYEASILVAALLDRRARSRAADADELDQLSDEDGN